MFSSRLFWKIFAANAVLTIIAAAAFASILSNRERVIVGGRIERRLRDAAVILRDQTAGIFSVSGGRPAADEGPPIFIRGRPPTPALQRRLRRLSEQTGMRLTLIAPDGKVLGDSDEDPAVMDDHSNRLEILQARRTGLGVSQRQSPTLEIPMMYVALRVGDERNPAGFVRTAMPIEDVNEQVAAVQRLVWGTALTVGLAALFLTYFVVGRITRPLDALTAAATAISGGSFGRQVEINNRDELGALARAFNSMSRQLAARVDELQQQSRELKENSERMATILSGMVEGVIAVDPNEQILFANRAARDMLNLNGAIGRPFWESVRNSTIQRVVHDALAGRDDPHAVEIELPRGQSVVGLLATRLPGDPCPGVVLVLHDVTELRRLENVRREFVSNVSHELKTPLTAIQAYTETLLNGAIDDPENNREFLGRIEQQAERLGKLIHDLLRLARIESGRDLFELTSVSLNQVIPGCVQQHQAVAETKGVSLSSEPPESDIEVRADIEGIRTVLDNLIDNAVKYTPEGGRITVRWQKDESWASIQVADSGVGIAEKHLPRIFERFYRADKARSRELGGTGLGLSIVKHLVQEFGGRIDVESAPGRGTTFAVRLPVVKS